ncbi:unnamed protein product [Toxocara canis]|uniref:Acyl-CoA dehydrogenase n=1 Tax=Toxocara canis TaxID=6265 RepID=A0A183URS1_TOXCA|nr:unnamed protein product [Toxocara canis]
MNAKLRAAQRNDFIANDVIAWTSVLRLIEHDASIFRNAIEQGNGLTLAGNVELLTVMNSPNEIGCH